MLKIVRKISSPDLENIDIDHCFNSIKDFNIEWGKKEWEKDINKITDEQILKALRYKKDWTLKAVQAKSIYTFFAWELITSFTNSYLANHVRINKVWDYEVELVTGKSYFSF